MNEFNFQPPQQFERNDSIDRVVLINDFSKVRGGAAALVVLLAEKLVDAKINVTLITGDDGEGLRGAANKIEIVALNEPPLLSRPPKAAAIKGLYNPSAERMLSDWISRNDTPKTIYHVHNWSHILSASIFRALHVVGERTVMHAHDYFLACPNGAFVNYRTGNECPLTPLSFACLSTNCDRRNYSQKLWRAGRHAIRKMLWDFDRYQADILLIHERMSEPFERSGIAESRLRTIRNPSVPYTESRVQAENNAEYIFIGRVEEEKGVNDFLNAAEKAGAPARVIGDGSALRELKDQFPQVTFDGWQSRDGIAELVKSARMLVVPSRYPEPFGLVIMEALASGLPVILPHSALLKTEIVEQEIGIACDTRSIDELAEVIESSRTDDDKIESMSRRAFDRRDKLALDPKDWSDQIVSYYRTLLGKDA
jgi:glycosyltransferase involved in cell wall biosynthesis